MICTLLLASTVVKAIVSYHHWSKRCCCGCWCLLKLRSNRFTFIILSSSPSEHDHSHSYINEEMQRIWGHVPANAKFDVSQHGAALFVFCLTLSRDICQGMSLLEQALSISLDGPLTGDTSRCRAHEQKPIDPIYSRVGAADVSARSHSAQLCTVLCRSDLGRFVFWLLLGHRRRNSFPRRCRCFVLRLLLRTGQRFFCCSEKLLRHNFFVSAE